MTQNTRTPNPWMMTSPGWIWILLFLSVSCSDSNPEIQPELDMSTDMPVQDVESDTSEDAPADADSDIPELPQEVWEVLPDIENGARQETAVLALNNEVWVIGGFNERLQMLNTVDIYNPDSRTWRSGPTLPASMHHVNAAIVNNSVWIVGFLGSSFREDGRIFELVDDNWIPRGEMPDGRARGASVVCAIGTDIYVVGGLRSGAVSQFDRFDTEALEWTTLPDFPRSMDHGAGACFEGEIFIAGGRHGSIEAHTSQTHAFDPQTQQWRNLADMPTSRGGVAFTMHQGRLFVLGGEGNTLEESGVYETVESYDPADNSWSQHSAMRFPRHGMGAASAGGGIIVPGGAGVQAFGAVADVDVFFPERE